MPYRWLRSMFLALSLLPVAASTFAQSDSLATSSSGRPQSQGSVPGDVPSGPLNLSLDEAVKRGLRYNLGTIESQQSLRQAHGAIIAERSALLPNLSSYLREVDQQIDLASFGFKFNAPPSLGFSIPSIVGPFNYFDLRAGLTQKGAKSVASILGDIEKGGAVEAKSIVGDMLARARKHGVAAPNLRFAYAHLQTYEARRARGGLSK